MFTCEAIEKAKPSDIEALAEKLEPALARAIRDLITDHVARVDLDALEAALKDGQTYKVLDIIGDVDPVKAGQVRDALQNAVWAGGALAVQQSPVFSEVKFAFNRLNPSLITWLEGYHLNLIRSVEEGTRAAVRSALLDGMKAGRNPIDQARQIKQAVGLTESQAKAVANYRKELETFHLKRSAKSWGLGNERSKLSGVDVMPRDAKGKPLDGIEARRLRDQRYDATLKRSMETRTPLKPEQIAKMVTRYQERMIQGRARTIARTESLRATNVGVAEAWRQAIDDGKIDGSLVRKRWAIAKDERLCPLCLAIYRAQPKRGIRINEAFENPKGLVPIKAPPGHPSCRCVIQVRQWEAEQLAEAA